MVNRLRSVSLADLHWMGRGTASVHMATLVCSWRCALESPRGPSKMSSFLSSAKVWTHRVWTRQRSISSPSPRHFFFFIFFLRHHHFLLRRLLLSRLLLLPSLYHHHLLLSPLRRTAALSRGRRRGARLLTWYEVWVLTHFFEQVPEDGPRRGQEADVPLHLGAEFVHLLDTPEVVHHLDGLVEVCLGGLAAHDLF